MSNSTLKVLVSGDVNGHFKELFTRVTSVNRKSGPFDMLLCVGNFFSSECDTEYDELINGSLELPSIPVYILGPNLSSQCKYYRKNDDEITNFDAGFELTDGLTFLGKSGVLTSSNGIRIAYISGVQSSHNDHNDPNESKYTFNTNDCDSLILTHQSSSSIIDILLTNQWPKHIFKYSDGHTKELQQMNDNLGSELIAKLSRYLRPRYHFVGSYGTFYERHPYRNHIVLSEAQRHVTRFLSLADVGNKSKSKWLYAFSLSPANAIDRNELIKQPIDVTENPFSDLRFDDSDTKMTRNDLSEKPKQFFYDFSNNNNEQMAYQNRKRRDNRGDFQNRKPRSEPPQPQDPCWFCLSSPEVEKHLIISIGEHSYLAMAKGGLTNDHLLILPIGHLRSTVEIADNEEINDEINKFKTALSKYFDSKGSTVVFFERNYRSSHLQIQVVPVPKDKTNTIKSTICGALEERDFKFNELPDNCDLKDMINPGVPYFYIEVPNGKMFIKIKGKEYFPIQLGRELLAHSEILNCHEKIDWKMCTLSNDESKDIAKRIRKEFAPFDFTLS